MGDCEGNDQLCKKYKSNSVKTARISRFCGTSPKDADNPDVCCIKNHQKEMFEIISYYTADELKSVSFHKHSNAFYKLHFGASATGVYGGTPCI